MTSKFKFVATSLLLVIGILLIKPVFAQPEQNPQKSIQLDFSKTNLGQTEQTEAVEAEDLFVEEPTEIKEMEILNTSEIAENIEHTVTLQRTEPIKAGDEYAWEIVSEPGELNASLSALGLSNLTCKAFGDADTTVVYTQDGIDLELISNKLNLDINDLLVSNASITITYSQDDITY